MRLVRICLPPHAVRVAPPYCYVLYVIRLQYRISVSTVTGSMDVNYRSDVRGPGYVDNVILWISGHRYIIHEACRFYL